ncbi:DUF817 family protein [Deinococcus arboris]|uniref:DUF817 family protein n=1 Tax=Deinococcus arboris TaxID=2682977 RepID=UPI001E307995|nr:DUF817 family protein [Deinococcus arboris]
MPRPLWRTLWHFTLSQVAACTFAFAVVALLLLSRTLPLAQWGVPRYDFLLLGCLLVQLVLVAIRFETVREAGVILLFHLLGFLLEAFKVARGGWTYPEDAWSKVLDVPLYAGFMYASVGSYVAQAWRRCQLQVEGVPPLRIQAALIAVTYLHFFLAPSVVVRLGVSLALVLAYRRTAVTFTVAGEAHRMPLLLAFVLIGGFVYLAENLATALGAWVYPYQVGGWQPVAPAK